MTGASSPLLQIEDLRVSFSTRAGRVQAVKGVSIDIDAGQTLGVVGESGSGKSVTAYAALGLLDRAGRIDSGVIRYGGRDITNAPYQELRSLRGARISMIFQNARAALNPIRTVGDQITDVIEAHEDAPRSEARRRALDMLETVRIRDAAHRIEAYPHELSGGMCQRVMIALALACSPDLLIADEPTTGLDVTTQKTIMDLVSNLSRERGMATILITHDLGLASLYCDRVAVMEAGEVVEQAPSSQLFSAPAHRYSQRLVAATPRRETPPLYDPNGPAAPDGARPLLDLVGLRKVYDEVVAVDDVSLSIYPGESLGVVGESGSGKTTVSRIATRLLDPTSGDIWFDGVRLDDVSASRFHRHPMRREIQIVFQDPTESLNPRFTSFDSIIDPLRRLTGERDQKKLRARAEELADRVGLPGDLLARLPHQLSGGQKARVGIARALALSPKLLVLDEPTAALDVSVQAVVLELLARLRREENLSYLFVSHDLNVVRMLCERVIVMRAGKVVESGRSDVLLSSPEHAYTAELVDAIPQFRPRTASPAA